MQYPKYLIGVAILALFMPVAVFAGSKNSATIQLPDTATVGSTQLQAGTYKVEWTGSGSNVNVNFIQHKTTVATTTAQLKTNDNAATEDAVVLKPSANNSGKEVTEIDLAKHKQALLLNQGGMNPGQ